MTKKENSPFPIWSILNSLFWGFIIVMFVLVPLVYFFVRLSDPVFRDGTMGNWFASIVGVLVGVPIALWLDRSISSRREKQEHQRQQILEKERKKQFVQMLRDSLIKNRGLLEQIERELRPTVVIYYNVDTQILESTASIKYEIIDDLELNQQLDYIKYELLHIHRKIELQLTVAYGDYKVAGGRQNFIQARTELTNAILVHVPTIQEAITRAINIMERFDE